MILKYWTLKREAELQESFKKYKIPEKVQEVIRNTLKILDDNYGSDRSVADDDGGYVAVLIPDTENNVWKEYDEVLKGHHLEREYTEFEDVIATAIEILGMVILRTTNILKDGTKKRITYYACGNWKRFSQRRSS